MQYLVEQCLSITRFLGRTSLSVRRASAALELSILHGFWLTPPYIGLELATYY